jgi:hypothetical protein
LRYWSSWGNDREIDALLPGSLWAQNLDPKPNVPVYLAPAAAVVDTGLEA